MRKRIFGLLLVVLIVVSMFAACGGAKSTEGAIAPSIALADNISKGEAFSGSDQETASQANAGEAISGVAAKDASAIIESDVSNQSVTSAILAQRKVIRNANVSVEVENFDIAYGKLNSIILSCGYIQESNINKDKVHVNSKEILVTRGIIIIRVDKDRFDGILKDIRGLGVSYGESIKTEEVTDQYFDVESRLRLLKYEENRLEQYLNKISDPDIIFKTESRLTEIRHEIEGLTGTLKKWDDLIQLSTITININEKVPGSDNPVVKGYGDRLLGDFLNSIKGVVVFCGELIIVLVQALPVLILLGLFAIVIVAIYKKLKKGKSK